jgi:hypothetical protein
MPRRRGRRGGARFRPQLRPRMLAARLGAGERLERDQPGEPRVLRQQHRSDTAPSQGTHHAIWADFRRTRRYEHSSDAHRIQIIREVIEFEAVGSSGWTRAEDNERSELDEA